MEIKKNIPILAFAITLFLLLTILLVGSIMNKERKDYVTNQMDIIRNMNDIQSYSLMSDVYGTKIACLALKTKLKDWDVSLWDLGIKLEQYRAASEEFQKDPFYQKQKTTFNENQLMYLLFLTKIKKECSLDQSIITFFYQNSADCKKCDDQSFVLTDVKRAAGDGVSIFSFDMDLNITNVELLKEYYEIDELPCIIIDESKFCSIRDKNFITEQICKGTPALSFCPPQLNATATA